MTELILAVSVFLVTHLVPALTPVRAALVRGLGEKAYFTLYSMASLGVIVWMAGAYGAAPYIETWPAEVWPRWLAVSVMVPASVLLVAGIASPNPFSLGRGRKGFDAARPGIVGICRHPVIWGMGLWAAVHIAANGDLASLILFGTLLGLGLAGPRRLDAKRRARMGDDVFEALVTQTRRTGTLAALAQTGFWRIAGGLVFYAVLLSGHEAVIGVAPLGG